MRIRPEKVAHMMRREVADILERKLRDPRVTTTVTVTDVEITPDLSFARIYVTMLGGEETRDAVMDALAHAAGFVRRELGHRLELREVPEIRFQYDASLERGARVDELLRRIANGERAGDEPEGGGQA